MDLPTLLKSITPDIYQNLKRSLELGKWPDGKLLTEEQRELTMQAVIVYEAQHIAEDQRAGYIDRSKKTACAKDSEDTAEEQVLQWADD